MSLSEGFVTTTATMAVSPMWNVKWHVKPSSAAHQGPGVSDGRRMEGLVEGGVFQEGAYA